jgi:hypothetical protein
MALSLSVSGKWGSEMPAGMKHKQQPCSMAEPCGQEGCGACYPDEVMRQKAEARQAREQARAERARDLDRTAGLAYRAGDYHKALTLLGEVRELDPELPDLSGHIQRVRAAERAAVAKAAEPRDLGQLADSFAERPGPQQRYQAERDANRGAPAGRCDGGEAGCPQQGHRYPAGRRCDEHRARAQELPERTWTPAENSLATYVAAEKEYADLSHGNPGHQCVMPDQEPGR